MRYDTESTVLRFIRPLYFAGLQSRCHRVAFVDVSPDEPEPPLALLRVLGQLLHLLRQARAGTSQLASAAAEKAALWRWGGDGDRRRRRLRRSGRPNPRPQPGCRDVLQAAWCQRQREDQQSLGDCWVLVRKEDQTLLSCFLIRQRRRAERKKKKKSLRH